MADVKIAYSSPTNLTLTSLNSLASSATAGWQSDAIDNSSNLYLDILIQAEIAAVNTAPANSKAHFLYVASLIDTATPGAYTSTGDGVPSGSVGTITFPDVTSNALPIPLLGVIPYPTQNKALNSAAFSVAAAFNNVLPKKIVLCWINHTGYTIAASGNAVRWIGVYNTVS
jgi:hypothetical protein